MQTLVANNWASSHLSPRLFLFRGSSFGDVIVKFPSTRTKQNNNNKINLATKTNKIHNLELSELSLGKILLTSQIFLLLVLCLLHIVIWPGKNVLFIWIILWLIFTTKLTYRTLQNDTRKINMDCGFSFTLDIHSVMLKSIVSSFHL